MEAMKIGTWTIQKEFHIGSAKLYKAYCPQCGYATIARESDLMYDKRCPCYNEDKRYPGKVITEAEKKKLILKEQPADTEPRDFLVSAAGKTRDELVYDVSMSILEIRYLFGRFASRKEQRDVRQEVERVMLPAAYREMDYIKKGYIPYDAYMKKYGVDKELVLQLNDYRWIGKKKYIRDLPPSELKK